MIVFAVLFGALVFIAVVYVNVSPEFGGLHLEDRVRLYQESGLYKKGKFINPVKTEMNMPIGTALGVLAEFLSFKPERFPAHVPIKTVHPEALANPDTSLTKIIWLGHSAFIIQAKGKTILLDPMFGDVPAPHPWLGTKRYYPKMPISIEQLPEIDIILFSHDHYDHLDYGSIKKLKEKTKQFVVPLGIGAHLEAWGVKKKHIVELSWWDEIEMDSFKLTCTPSRHFSGRGILDRFSTLWSSWVIETGSKRLYFSGDSGYGPHFKEIGERFGSFDFAMMECGQYDKRWEEIHMLPNQTVLAAKDLQAQLFMPIHWAAFSLSLHAWNDPPKQAEALAKTMNQPVLIPEIGEIITLEKLQNVPLVSDWWRD